MPVDFYYRECTTGQHVSAAVGALMAAVALEGRVNNVYATEALRSELRERIELACAGELKPLDHVKSIDGYPTIDMFEIRWVRRPLTFAGSSGNVHRKLDLRLLYVEAAMISSYCVVGLHAHTKAIVEGNSRANRRAQDDEIDYAVCLYGAMLEDRWGIPELRPPS